MWCPSIDFLPTVNKNGGTEFNVGECCELLLANVLSEGGTTPTSAPVGLEMFVLGRGARQEFSDLGVAVASEWPWL